MIFPNNALLKQKFMRFMMTRGINLWPPFLGAGIRVISSNESLTKIDVSMNLTWFNRNIVGTQFGGSLYAMCDPFYMAIIMNFLGPKYTVWDKAASIKFLKPGKERVFASFSISSTELSSLKDEVDRLGKIERVYLVDVTTTAGLKIAQVEKTLSIISNSKRDLRRLSSEQTHQNGPTLPIGY